jgi:pSer/pThr/pTyr-binding forkhead associated (FHA) protein
MPAHLLSLADGPSILIDKPILLFGRHEECDVQLNSKKVSRRHCVLAQVSDYLVIRDLGSTNGVRINGQRVADFRSETSSIRCAATCSAGRSGKRRPTNTGPFRRP